MNPNEVTFVTRQDTDSLKLVYLGTVKLGEAVKDVDGFFYFWFEKDNGSWPSCILRAIADKLDALNAPWEKTINEEFEKRQETRDQRNQG